MTLWRYVIANDDGSAPNYARPAVTLAICKPKIRKNAKEKDLIVAFAGRHLRREKGARWNPQNIIWAGVVSEVLTFSEYWSDPRFRNKRPGRSRTPDNIYRPSGARLLQVRSPVHQRPTEQARDISGKNVLVFEHAWHFGENGEPLPRQFAKLQIDLRGRRGHRRDEIDVEDAESLKKWLAEAGKLMPGRSSRSKGHGCSTSQAISCGGCGEGRRARNVRANIPLDGRFRRPKRGRSC